MPKESLEHLNNQTLIGATDKRNHVWHYRAACRARSHPLPRRHPRA